MSFKTIEEKYGIVLKRGQIVRIRLPRKREWYIAYVKYASDNAFFVQPEYSENIRLKFDCEKLVNNRHTDRRRVRFDV